MNLILLDFIMENNGTFDEFMFQIFEITTFQIKTVKIINSQFIRNSYHMFVRRYQDAWKSRVNNASLLINPDQSDV